MHGQYLKLRDISESILRVDGADMATEDSKLRDHIQTTALADDDRSLHQWQWWLRMNEIRSIRYGGQREWNLRFALLLTSLSCTTLSTNARNCITVNKLVLASLICLNMLNMLTSLSSLLSNPIVYIYSTPFFRQNDPNHITSHPAVTISY